MNVSFWVAEDDLAIATSRRNYICILCLRIFHEIRRKNRLFYFITPTTFLTISSSSYGFKSKKLNFLHCNKDNEIDWYNFQSCRTSTFTSNILKLFSTHSENLIFFVIVLQRHLFFFSVWIASGMDITLLKISASCFKVFLSKYCNSVWPYHCPFIILNPPKLYLFWWNFVGQNICCRNLISKI